MLLRAALEHFGTTVARSQKWDGKVECECSPGYALPLPYKWALIERVEASADNQRDLAGVADHGLAQLAQWAIHRADHHVFSITTEPDRLSILYHRINEGTIRRPIAVARTRATVCQSQM